MSKTTSLFDLLKEWADSSFSEDHYVVEDMIVFKKNSIAIIVDYHEESFYVSSTANSKKLIKPISVNIGDPDAFSIMEKLIRNELAEA